MSNMKIGVVGSRSITTYKVVREAIEESPWLGYVPPRPPSDTIVSGGAAGVDTLAERYADYNDTDIEVLEPDWEDWSDGHPAKVRNSKIIEQSDAVIAVWDGKSNGTRDSIDKALDTGTDIYVKIV